MSELRRITDEDSAMKETRVPDAELAVLKELWTDGPLTVRDLAGRLYPGGGPSEHATVQKLLERLLTRKCVRRKRGGRAHVWSAAVAREELIRDRLREAADKLCEGSLTPLLTELVHAGKLAPQEIAELRRLIDELPSEGRS
jgi:predicted transcriptional regulator